MHNLAGVEALNHAYSIELAPRLWWSRHSEWARKG